MKKKFTILIAAAVMLLTMMATTGEMWGQTREDLVLTFSLTSNPGGWPTANSTTLTNYTYTLNTVEYTFALMNVKCNSGYLMLTQPAVLGVPAIEGYKLTKIVASNSSGCSTSTKVGISSSASSPSYIGGGEIQTWSTQSSSYTYTLTSTAANTMYYIYVTNKNAQIISLALTYAPGGGGSDPTITLSESGTLNIGNYAVNAALDSRTFTVSQSNLSEGITLTATNGGTLTPNSIDLDADPTEVTWNFTTPAEAGQFTSVITATSGETSASFTYLGYAYANHNVIIAEMEHGTVIADPTSTYYYQNVTLTVTPDEGYELGTLSVVDGNNDPVTVTNNSFKMPDSDATVSATFVESSGSTVTDELTNSNTIGETTNTYSEWTATGISGAEYAGQSAGGNGTIQLRSNNSNSGIVSTTSGGKVKKVTVTWNSGTADGRTLNVYGKNTAYEDPTNLYGSSTQGTLLGTIVKGTSTELTVSGDYAYVGLRSASGAMYLDEIDIDWETSGTPTCAAPTFTPAAGTYYETQSVTIASATEGATIYYTLDGTDPTTSSSVYSSALSISETTTVKAMAVKDGYNNSTVSTALYTITLPLVATPTFTPAAGTYTETQSVTIACTTEGATIYYTIDGTEPTTSSSVYSEALSISETTTVKAMAVKTGMSNSEIATAVYNIEQALNTMQAIYDRATEVGNTATSVNIALQNWVVSGVSTNGKNVFVTDGTKGFVIYNSDANMGFVVGNILSGTVSCKVQLYNGFAELTQLNSQTSGISVATGGEVIAANIAMADLAGVNTGALVHYENLTCSVLNNKYYLSDGTTTLQVYYALYDFGTTLVADHEYNITGVYQQYTVSNTNTKEILPRSADDIEEVIPTDPIITVNPATVNVTAEGADGILTVTYDNFTDIAADVWFCNATGTADATYDWITAEIDDQTNNVEYFVEPNDGEERTAYFKVWAYDDDMNEVYSNLVSVTQAEYVAPTYAELPFSFNGGRADIEDTDGLSQEGLGTDYNASTNPNTQLKFDGTGDWLLLQFNERPGTLTFDIKGNSFNGGTFKVQTSTDGTIYTDLGTYNALGDTQSEEFNLADDVRYIKWVYTEKSNGNVGLGNIGLTEYVEPTASITVTPNLVEATIAETDDYLGIAYVALDITQADDFGIQFYDNNSQELNGDDEPDWIQAEAATQIGQEGYFVYYVISANTGAARSAYFKVYAFDNNAEPVYSNLVTVNQAAVPSPVINAEDIEIEYDATSGEIAYTIDNPTTATLTATTTAEWISNITVEAAKVTFTTTVNEGDADRIGTITLSYTGAEDKSVTVKQGHHVVDYAELPFVWEGGSSADFAALNGVTLSGNGSDYNNNYAPYLIKLDGDGDYIMVKTNSQPGIVTIGVKMIGGGNTSMITVQGSADGTTFTDVEALTISGAQNDILTLTTTNSFAATDRYVRLYFTKGSNVGVGPITIAKHIVKYAVNLNQPLNNEGTIEADKTEAAEGETVTLTATPNTGYAFVSWTVLDGDAQEVTITNNTFEMPASDVEVEASFTALDKHNIVIPEGIENNVIVDATGNQAYAGETVTITVDAPENKVLATLTVTGNPSSTSITIDPVVSPYVDEYSFTMPDEDVTINATFTNAPSFTVLFSVNGSVDDDLEISVTQGQNIALPTSSTLTPEGFSITGWAATNGSAEAIADPYTPTEDITLYAILRQSIPHSMVINASTANFPSSYASWDEYNLEGKNFMIKQGYINTGKLQWRSANHSSGAGTMYNSDDLGKINTIILVYDSSDSNKNFTIKAGTDANPTEGDNITPTYEEESLVYTFDLSGGDYNYFVMTNGDGAGYLQSISIDYVSDLNVNTITHIETTTTLDTDIPATTCVIVESGAVLTFNGDNNGTVDNLIIEDGGQIIHDNAGVKATVKKSITGYGTGTGNYYLLVTPFTENIDPASVTNMIAATPANYDLYQWNSGEAEEWRNYKQGTFTLNNGIGHLYANKNNVELTFTGTLKQSNEVVTVNPDYITADFGDWTLVGNPFPCDAYIIDANSSMAFYRMKSAGNGFETATGAIKPMEGIFVQTTEENQSFKFTREAPSANAGKGDLNIQVAQVTNTRDAQSVADNAIIRFDGGSTLQKFSFRDDNAKIYIPQGNKNYAVVAAQAQGEMPVNFKAAENGTYTIDFSMDNVEFSYLHLIDNKTGMDIDLLQTSSYTFEASKIDYASRFKLVFSTNSNSNSNDDNDFAFFDANGNLLILGNEGTATLQVIDITGRTVSNETFSGNYSKAINAKAGVYMLRLIQGNDVRTQKIVVR